MAVNQKAVKVLNKVFEAGFADEKAIASMTMDDILSMQGITVADITLINDLQKSIKSNKVISFLGGMLRLFSENGDAQCVLCCYIDENHTEIDGVKYDNKDFIRRMKHNRISYAPA